MKDIKDMCSKYWHIILIVFFVGFMIGIVTYTVIYALVIDSINQKIKENGRLGYVIEVSTLQHRM